MGVKAAAGNWVIQRRNEAKHWPYKECEAEKTSKNWAPGIVPQTDACYRSALDFTTLSHYQFEFKFAAIPFQLEKMMGKLGDMISLSLLPYWKAEPTSTGSNSASKEVGHVQVNITFLPDIVDEGHQSVNLHWSTNNVIERYDGVNLPFDNIILPSTSIPQTTRIAYEGDAIRITFKSQYFEKSWNRILFCFLKSCFPPCSLLPNNAAVHSHIG